MASARAAEVEAKSVDAAVELADSAGAVHAPSPEASMRFDSDAVASATIPPGETATVSLEDRTVTVGENTFVFEVDDYTRWRLMEGLDDISLTLRHEDDIEAFEDARPSWKPSTLVR